MSLLMDALKKAEQAKRQNQPGEITNDSSAAPGNLELSPLDAGLAPAPPLPELPEHMASLDREFERTPRPGRDTKTPPAAAGAPTLPNVAPPRLAKQGSHTAPAAAKAVERDVAQNVFQVKQASDSNKLFPVFIVTFSLIAVAVIGLYFWMQLQPGGSYSLSAGAAAPARSLPAATAPAAQVAAATVAGQTSAGQVAASARPTAPATSPTKDAPSGTSRKGVDEAIAAADRPISITTARLQVNPALVRGYAAFSAGNLAEARNEYEQLLKGEPKNGEALLALAAISLRQGQPNQAEDYYLRAIEADPKDAQAQAGLIALRGQGEPIESESRLKNLIFAQPAVPALHLALGNVYARQGRWNEAQESYFKAYSGDGDNPDVIFNLAVSLDQLRQPALAAQYYRQALAAAANRQTGFDPVQVGTRLRELSQ